MSTQTLTFLLLMLLLLTPGVIWAFYRFRAYQQSERERESRWGDMLTGDQLAELLKESEDRGSDAK